VNKNLRYISVKKLPTITDHPERDYAATCVTWYVRLIRLHDEHIAMIKRTGTPHLLDDSAVSRYAQ